MTARVLHDLRGTHKIKRRETRAVKEFIAKHASRINGVVSSFDRIMFKGYLPICSGESMESFMDFRRWLRKDFKRHVSQASETLKRHVWNLAQRAGRRYVPLQRSVRKEDLARRIASEDGVTQGLVCVMTAVEGCQSFRMIPGKDRPRIVSAARKCLCVYVYFIDRELGFMHVRLQTWFPFTIQVCVNGHEALARSMTRHKIGYQQVDNCFVAIDNCRRAQRLADNLARRDWPRLLSALARRVNPLMGGLLGAMDYYWVTQQAEYSTDVMFRRPEDLAGLYEGLLRHATLCFSPEDVMIFLGYKGLHGNFAGAAGAHAKRRWPGARVRHDIKGNVIKMYNKHGSVLRIETVINNPYEFKVYREGRRKGRRVLGWYPMAKRVGNLRRYAEVSLAANGRYLAALSAVEDPSQAITQIQQIARPARKAKRSYRGFNPADENDVRLFQTVLRGEHAVRGLRNADIRQRLFRAANGPERRRLDSARVSRLLKRLHVHGLIAKIPRSRRWRVTKKGQMLMGGIVMVHHELYPQAVLARAA